MLEFVLLVRACLFLQPHLSVCDQVLCCKCTRCIRAAEVVLSTCTDLHLRPWRWHRSAKDSPVEAIKHSYMLQATM